MAVSKALEALKEHQEDLKYNSLRIGDVCQYPVVSYISLKEEIQNAIVYRKNEKTMYRNGKSVNVLVTNSDSVVTFVTAMELPPLIMLSTSMDKNLLAWAFQATTMGYDDNVLDNLTYVEILARLKEYESQI